MKVSVSQKLALMSKMILLVLGMKAFAVPTAGKRAQDFSDRLVDQTTQKSDEVKSEFEKGLGRPLAPEKPFSEAYKLKIPDLLRYEMDRLHRIGDAKKTRVKLPSTDLSQKIIRDIQSSDPEEKNSPPDTVSVAGLDGFLKRVLDGKFSLDDSEKRELLGVLRANNSLLRGLEKDLNAALRSTAIQELKGMDRSGGKGPISLPSDVAQALQAESERLKKEGSDLAGNLNGELTPKGLKDLLENPKFNKDALTPKQWADLAGAAREQAPDQRQGDFFSSNQNDLVGDWLKDTNQPQNVVDKFHDLLNPDRTGLEDDISKMLDGQNADPQNPNFQLPPPKQDSSGGGSPSGGGGGPKGGGDHSKKGQGSPSGGGGRPSGGGGHSPGGGFGGPGLQQRPTADLPPEKPLSAEEKAPFEAIKKGIPALSLVMSTYYQNSGGPSTCQLTLASRAPAPGKAGQCEYVAVTARHCVVNTQQQEGSAPVENIGDPIAAVEVNGLGVVSNPRRIIDPGVGDMGLLKFRAACNEALPIVPISGQVPTDGMPIMADTNGGGFLVGRALANNATKMEMDLRDPSNRRGIQPGDSGGGVFAMGTDANGLPTPVIIGVVSAQYLDPRLAQIGIMATSQNALSWAASEIAQAQPDAGLISRASSPTSRGNHQ